MGGLIHTYICGYILVRCAESFRRPQIRRCSYAQVLIVLVQHEWWRNHQQDGAASSHGWLMILLSYLSVGGRRMRGISLGRFWRGGRSY